MELTIEQALQQGVAAHKEGKLQEAERLYQAILQSQPKHPDANHNLGLIAVAANKVETALPLFKTALEANPKIEQFWLSYIDALIKGKQSEVAKQVIEQAEKQGVSGEKINVFERQLQSLIQDDNAQPSDTEINTLLQYYQNGHYGDAEQLAVSLTERFPTHPFSWTILGALLKQTGRPSESLTAMQKSVQLAPQDAGAHSNLGVMLQELGRLEEAEANFVRAVELKPDLAEAHFNLGNTLRELGRLEEAEASYRQAIALKPDADVHYNLGFALRELGRLDEAEASYRQAVALKPDYAEAHFNLGNTLKELGRLDEAEACCREAIALKPDYPSAKHIFSAITAETTATAPQEYVEELFDNYADKFESALVDDLEYKMPRLIAGKIIEDSELDLLGSIVDLGCGTGLFGREIKQFCEYLEGVDLSGKMLDQAKEKNVYDKLIKQNIVDYLSTASMNFDYFISADVFIYVGDLTEVFRLIKSRNRSGGKLAFSTEDYDGDGFFLEQSGRYSHSKTYIEFLCEKFGFKLRHFETKPLRKEKTQFIKGGLYLLDF